MRAASVGWLDPGVVASELDRPLEKLPERLRKSGLTPSAAWLSFSCNFPRIARFSIKREVSDFFTVAHREKIALVAVFS